MLAQNFQTFNFENFDVRVIVIDDTPWFVAMDLAKVLKYADPSKMVNLVDDDDHKKINPQKLSDPRMAETFGSNTFSVSIVNESGLYAIIFNSTKEEAKKFKRWVTSEVLPSIRTTGKYELPSKPKTAIELAEETVQLAQQNLQLLLDLERQKMLTEELEKENELLSEAVDELFNYSSIIRVAKFNNVSETQFSWRVLKAASKQLGVEVKKVPCPRFEWKNLYSHDAWRIAYANIQLPETTTLVIHNSSQNI